MNLPPSFEVIWQNYYARFIKHMETFEARRLADSAIRVMREDEEAALAEEEES